MTDQTVTDPAETDAIWRATVSKMPHRTKEEAIQRYAAGKKVDAPFKRFLALEFGEDLSSAVHELIYEKAYSDGHHAGYFEIQNQYIEAADFARSIILANNS